MLMDLPGLSRLDDDSDARSLGLSDQVVMHGAGCQQGADGDAVLTNLPVGKDDQTDSVIDRPFRFVANTVQRGDQSFATVGLGPRDVNRPSRPAAMFDVFQRRQLLRS